MGDAVGRPGVCPRCGRELAEPNLGLCRQCYDEFVGVKDAPARPGERVVRVRVSPLVREALDSGQPGEDFDEALLRVLKAHYAEEATSLLPAVARTVQVEQRIAGHDREQALRRLAAADPGPEIVLRTSRDRDVVRVAQSTSVRIGGQEYHSLEEVPPHLREVVARGMSQGGATRRMRIGCSAGLIAAWIIALLRGPEQ